MRVAIVHDSLTQFGGAERVLLALHELYPQAPVFTLVYDKNLQNRFEGWTIVTSPLQYLYKVVPSIQYLLPLIPFALRFFDFSNFDLVISSSSIFAKGIYVQSRVPHINYCHTPARFLWLDTPGYLNAELPAWLKPFKFFFEIYFNYMKSWDFKAAQRVSYFIANSKNTQARIKKFYARESEVIYPFVDTDFFYPSAPKGDYYLVGGRLQAHKMIELVIRLFNKNGLQLHVVGAGRAEPNLKAMARPNIQFLGKIEDQMLRNEYSGAKAFIFPQEEDFGIMPLEAMACGTPVLAYGKGGALETVDDNTGIFFYEQSMVGLEQVLGEFQQKTFLSENLFDRAHEFSKQRFVNAIEEFIQQKLEQQALET